MDTTRLSTEQPTRHDLEPLRRDLVSLALDPVARRSPSRGRLTWLLLVLVPVLGSLAWVWRATHDSALPPRPSAPTERETPPGLMATDRHISPLLSASGYVVADRISRLGARSVGRLAEVFVAEGDRVRRGQLLARLDLSAEQANSRSTRARVIAARARAATAHALLAENAQELARQQQLAAKGATPRARVETLELEVRATEDSAQAADAEALVAAAEFDRSRVDLADRNVRAPLDGIVITRPLAAGEVVGLPGSEPILELADVASLVVEADVPENRLHLVRLGQPCEIVLDAYPGRRYPGRVISVGARVSRAKATVAVKVRFAGDVQGILPDMAAQTAFLPVVTASEAAPPPDSERRKGE